MSEKISSKVSWNTVPSIICIHTLINKVRFSASHTDKRPAKKRQVLMDKKLGKTGDRSEHTPQKK
jgi:hypothetical protein